MMKKGLFKLIMVLMCMVFLVAPAMANNLAQHVSVACNAKGDLLIYPMYTALEGIETNMEVINTSATTCIVARVDFRSFKYSQDVLDFFIFLSPNDVFKGTVKYNNGKVSLVSSDDSLCVSGTCASVAAPQSWDLVAPCQGNASDDSETMGYITVTEAWSVVLPKGAEGTVAKADIIAAYAAAVVPFTPADTINALTGFAEIVFPGLEYLTYPATALRDYDNLIFQDVNSNPMLGVGSNNNLCEIEAALSKNNLAIPFYEDGAVPIITFPTKESSCPPLPVAQGSFFVQNQFNPIFGFQYYDMREHSVIFQCPVSPCPVKQIKKFDDEMNLEFEMFTNLSQGYDFSEGWARLTFGQNTACNDLSGGALTYGGAPLIGMVLELTADGASLLPLAYDYANVTYNRVNVTRMYQTGGGVTDLPPAVCGPANLGLCVDETDCIAAGGNWCAGVCQAAACEAPTTCADKDEADCTGDCYWNAFPNPVCILNCQQFKDQAACEAGLNSGCQWNSTAFGDFCAPKN